MLWRSISESAASRLATSSVKYCSVKALPLSQNTTAAESPGRITLRSVLRIDANSGFVRKVGSEKRSTNTSTVRFAFGAGGAAVLRRPGLRVLREVRDRLHASVLADLEIVGGQPGDALAFPVGDEDVHVHERDVDGLAARRQLLLAECRCRDDEHQEQGR